MKSVHIYMHNELKAFFTLCIYICIMCWQVIWKKNGKVVKGLKKYSKQKMKMTKTMTADILKESCYPVFFLIHIANCFLTYMHT